MRKYEITTGGQFFYGALGSSLGMVTGIYQMRDPIDRDMLQQAVDITMPRFPYFRVRAEVENGRYVLRQNDAPFPVFVSQEPIPPGDERANGHLVTFGCYDDTIWFGFFTGVLDGLGHYRAVQSVLYHYCLYRYGGSLESPGLFDLSAEPDPGEYADPFSFARMPENASELSLPREAFVLPEPRVPSGASQTLYTIDMPQSAFVKYTKSVDGSPAVMSALFLCRAIDRVHPEHVQPVMVQMPTDMRGALGCRRTAQYAIEPIYLFYDDRLRRMPLDRQATSFRGMVFVQSDPDQLMASFARRAELYRSLDAIDSLEGKRQALHMDSSLALAPKTSYMGKLDMGGIEQYRRKFTCTDDASRSGLMLETFTAGDTITLNLMCAVETDAYYQALLSELKEAGVEHHPSAPIPYVPMRRTF